MSTPEFTLPPKCPNCDRLTADNKNHCPEKSPAKWASLCQWVVCQGKRIDKTKGLIDCATTYGPRDHFPRLGAR